MRKLIFATLAAFSFVTPVMAEGGGTETRTFGGATEMSCVSFDVARRTLHDVYGEEIQMEALAPQEQEVFMLSVNKETQSWSLLVLYPDGVVCMVREGVGYMEDIPPMASGDPT
jgi:hypothetical protein